MALFKLLHLFAVIVWVGGMFFAYVVLRPSAVEVLEAPQRLRLWVAVFSRFFVWVWAAVAVLLGSGLYMIHLYGGFAHTPVYVNIMMTLGLAMMAIYAHVYFAYYKPMSVHVFEQRWPDAGVLLGRIRTLVGVNVILGVLTVCDAALGVLIFG